MKHFGVGLFLAAAVIASAGSAAATAFAGLTIDNVDINGVFYDVTFMDGTFNTVFPTEDLTFTNYLEAQDAADAIVARSEFLALKTPGFYGVLTPYGFNATTFFTAVAGGIVTPGSYNGDRSYNYSGSGSDAYTFATFAASAPEPGAWALMILGFGAVGAATRRRTARAA